MKAFSRTAAASAPAATARRFAPGFAPGFAPARLHPLARGLAIAFTLTALAACSSDDDDDEIGEGGNEPSSDAASFAVVTNDGSSPGSVTFFDGDLDAPDRTLSTGANEGIAFGPDGTLYQNSDGGGFTGLRAFANAAQRADMEGFDPGNGDSEISTTAGKGLSYVNGRLASCDVTDAAADLKLFQIGDGPASLSLDLDAPCWDTFYDEGNDRLYAALTDGRLAIFDEFGDELGDDDGDDTDEEGDADMAADRTITPTDAAGTQLSVNLHGVYAENGTVLVSDVGDAGSPSDGQLFTFVDDGMLDGNVISAAIGGPSTMLGNPVDVVLLDGTAYVAEKSNDALLGFDNIASLPAGDTMPDTTIAFTKPESIEIVVDGPRNDETPVNDVTDTTEELTDDVTDTTDEVTDTTEELTDGVTDTTDDATYEVTDTTEELTDDVTDATDDVTDDVTDATEDM